MRILRTFLYSGIAFMGVLLAAVEWKQSAGNDETQPAGGQSNAGSSFAIRSTINQSTTRRTADAIGDLQIMPVRDTRKSFPPPAIQGAGPDNVLGLPANNAKPDLALGNVSGFNFDEPLIRVNPNNPRNIVVTSHGGLSFSTDGGLNFSTPINYPNTLGGNNGDTGMTFDSQGRLFWATLFTPPGGSSARPLQIMQVNPLTGATVQNPIDVITASGDPATSSDDKEYIAADEYPLSPFTDNIYMVFTRLVGNWTVFTTFSTDQGSTWSALLPISTGADVQPWPSDIAVAPNGDVFATFHSGQAAGATGLTRVLRSTDGGVSFNPVTDAFTAGQSDVSSNVVGQPGAIPGLQFWMLGSGQPWILPDPTRPGNVYVVSNDDPDNVHGTANDDADIVFARSTDNGASWATSTIPDGSGGAHQVFPFAAIDQLGNIAVAWFDTRSGATNGFGNNLLDVWATYSTDGGLTWATAFQVNDANNPFDPDFPNNQRRFPTPQQTPCVVGAGETCRIGEYFGIDIDNGVAHLTWIGNTFDMGGNVQGDQLWYDSFGLPTDVSITKTDGITEIAAGEQLTYTITVENDGDVNAANVTVVDTLPSEAVFVASTIPCTESPTDVLTCNLGTMTPNQQIAFDVTVTIHANTASGVTLTNTATVSSDNFDTDSSNNTAVDGDTGVIREVDVVVTKTDNIDPVVAGSSVPNLRYNINVENLGPSSVTDLVLSEVLTLPPNVTLHEVNALSGSWNGLTNEWTVSIPAGGVGLLVVFVNVPLQADEADVVSNTISVTGSGGNEVFINTEDDSATETTAIRWPTANWEVSKEYETGGASPVAVHLECSDNVGLGFADPLEAMTTAQLSWRRFDINSAVCSVVETVPAGYYEVDRTEDCDVDPVVDTDDGGNYSCTITNAPTRATVRVTKEFSDGDHDTEVTVLLDCNTGLILDQDKVITEGPDNYVEFVITDFTDGTLNCIATEDTDLLPGYTPSYEGGVLLQQDDDDVGVLVTASGCEFTGVTGGAELYCEVTNDADPQPVVITKEWLFEGSSNPSDVDMYYELTLHCDAAVIIDGSNYCGNSKVLEDAQGENGDALYWCRTFSDDEPNTFEASVIPQYPSNHCWVTEELNSDYVEVTNKCENLQVRAGQGDACTVTNTVFFEGIPLLSRYSQMLLLLVLLGVGGLAIRRFS